MTTTTETEADRVASAFCNDGQRFDHPVSGDTLDHFCLNEGAYIEVWREYPDGSMGEISIADTTTSDRIRYVFPDGSAIVEHGDGWDHEGDEPGTWRG